MPAGQRAPASTGPADLQPAAPTLRRCWAWSILETTREPSAAVPAPALLKRCEAVARISAGGVGGHRSCTNGAGACQRRPAPRPAVALGADLRHFQLPGQHRVCLRCVFEALAVLGPERRACGFPATRLAVGRPPPPPLPPPTLLTWRPLPAPPSALPCSRLRPGAAGDPGHAAPAAQRHPHHAQGAARGLDRGEARARSAAAAAAAATATAVAPVVATAFALDFSDSIQPSAPAKSCAPVPQAATVAVSAPFAFNVSASASQLPRRPRLPCALQAASIAVSAAFAFYFSASVACYAALGNNVPGEVLTGFESERRRRRWWRRRSTAFWLMEPPSRGLAHWQSCGRGGGQRWWAQQAGVRAAASILGRPPPRLPAVAPDWVMVLANFCIVIHSEQRRPADSLGVLGSGRDGAAGAAGAAGPEQRLPQRAHSPPSRRSPPHLCRSGEHGSWVAAAGDGGMCLARHAAAPAAPCAPACVRRPGVPAGPGVEPPASPAPRTHAPRRSPPGRSGPSPSLSLSSR